MFDLTNFTLQDMTECGAGLRACGADAMDQATAAQAIVTYLRDSLVSKPDGRKSCALVRLYVTHPYQQLPPELQAFSSRIAGGEVNPGTRCLTLMATVGDRPEWCRPQDSSGHRAIPLLSESMVSQVPMVSRLLIQLGVDIKGLLAPDEGFIRAAANRSYNVFYVRQALGSPYIPAQREFVLPYGIGSVIGFGGLLPSGSLFAVLLFTTVDVAASTADQFKTLALNVKLALLPQDGTGRIFGATP